MNSWTRRYRLAQSHERDAVDRTNRLKYLRQSTRFWEPEDLPQDHCQVTKCTLTIPGKARAMLHGQCFGLEGGQPLQGTLRLRREWYVIRQDPHLVFEQGCA